MFAALPFTLTHYRLDEDTLSEQTGLFSVTTKSVACTQIRSTAVTQSRLQTLLELCTVRVATADPNVPEFILRNVRKDAKIITQLQNLADSVTAPHAVNVTPSI